MPTKELQLGIAPGRLQARPLYVQGSMKPETFRRPAVDPQVLARLDAVGRQNSVELLPGLVSLYQRSAERRRVALREACASGSNDGLERAAHALRSGSAQLGAVRLARLCRAIETCASRRPGSDLAPLVAATERELDRVLAELPAEPAADVDPAPAASARTTQGPRIVVVEDEPHVARLLKHVLENAGFRVSCAFDVVGGVAAVRSERPEALLLDIYLPDGTGIDLLRALGPERPVVLVLSARADERTSTELAELGVHARCAKPIAPSMLLALLDSLGIAAPRQELCA
jgi:CheY-like chemotaxis protein